MKKMQFEELKFNDLEEAFKILKQSERSGFDELSSNSTIDAYDSLEKILFHVSKSHFNQGCKKSAEITLILKLGD